jgi:hypothetical protein
MPCSGRKPDLVVLSQRCSHRVAIDRPALSKTSVRAARQRPELVNALAIADRGVAHFLGLGVETIHSGAEANGEPKKREHRGRDGRHEDEIGDEVGIDDERGSGDHLRKTTLALSVDEACNSDGADKERQKHGVAVEVHAPACVGRAPRASSSGYPADTIKRALL